MTTVPVDLRPVTARPQAGFNQDDAVYEAVIPANAPTGRLLVAGTFKSAELSNSQLRLQNITTGLSGDYIDPPDGVDPHFELDPVAVSAGDLVRVQALTTARVWVSHIGGVVTDSGIQVPRWTQGGEPPTGISFLPDLVGYTVGPSLIVGLEVGGDFDIDSPVADSMQYTWQRLPSGGTVWENLFTGFATRSADVRLSIDPSTGNAIGWASGDRFRVTLVNDHGNYTSPPAELTVKTPETLAVIHTSPPAGAIEIADGGSRALSVEVLGAAAPFEARWQTIVGGIWTTVEDWTVVATDVDRYPDLVVRPLRYVDDALTSHRVQVRDANGQTIDAAEWHHEQNVIPFVITDEPDDVTANAGDPGIFKPSTRFDGDAGPYVIEWRSQRPGEGVFAFGSLEATPFVVEEFNSGYNFNTATEVDVWATITDTSSGASRTTRRARLTVNAAFAVTDEPDDVTANAGDPGEFKPTARFDGPPDNYFITWYSQVPGQSVVFHATGSPAARNTDLVFPGSFSFTASNDGVLVWADIYSTTTVQTRQALLTVTAANAIVDDDDNRLVDDDGNPIIYD